jgi:hypothetical protein
LGKYRTLKRREMNKKKKGWIIVLIFFFIIAFLIFLLNSFLSKFDPKVDIEIVKYNEIDESIYIKAKAWGLAGNHNEILISTDLLENDNDCSKENCECMIFYASELYFKKVGKDSLIVYVGASTLPLEKGCLKSQVKVLVKEIKSYNEVQDYSKYYEDYGLSKVSVYSK